MKGSPVLSVTLIFLLKRISKKHKTRAGAGAILSAFCTAFPNAFSFFLHAWTCQQSLGPQKTYIASAFFYPRLYVVRTTRRGYKFCFVVLLVLLADTLIRLLHCFIVQFHHAFIIFQLCPAALPGSLA
jgi:Ca2+/Na+ antiporter